MHMKALVPLFCSQILPCVGTSLTITLRICIIAVRLLISRLPVTTTYLPPLYPLCNVWWVVSVCSCMAYIALFFS